MAWYRLRNAPAPWGDYGRMLVSGMATRAEDCVLEVERVGPFVPPIDMWSSEDAPIVTDAFRRSIEASGLRGACYREVRKARVVRIDWRGWNRTSGRPERLPSGAHPDSYVTGGEHDPALATEMGPLWEIYAEEAPEETDADFARAPGYHCLAESGVVVSDRAQKWLATHAAEWIRTQRLDPKPGHHRRLLSELRRRLEGD